MIRQLRNSGIGQIFLGTIVVAIILAFVFTGTTPAGTASSDDCVVQVGRSCISPKEYDTALRLVASIGLRDRAMKQLDLRRKIAQGLAEREVLLEEARRLGLATSEDAIDDELFEGRTRVSLPTDGSESLALSLAMCVNEERGCAPGTVGLRSIQVKRDGKFDFELYKRTVRVATGRSPAQFKEMQQKEYTAERVRQLIRGQVRVSPDETFLSYSRARSQATGRIVAVNTSWFQSYVGSGTSEERAAWAKDSKEAIDKAVTAAKEQWKVGCPVVSEIRIDNADPGGEEASSAKEKAEVLRRKAKLGESFSMLARTQSDADTAPLGGLVGCLDDGYGAGAAALIEAAKELEKAGDLSPVVETIRGFHVLRLTGVVSEENQEELIRAYVTEKLGREALAKKKAEAFAQELIKQAQAGTKLADAVEALVAKTLEEGDLGGKDNAGAEDDNRPKMVVSRAVSIDQNPIANSVPDANTGILLFDLKKDDDVHEQPIETKSGFAVLQLKSKDLMTREKFEEERPKLMRGLTQRKSEQVLADRIEALIKKAGGVSFNSKYITLPSDEKKKNKEKDS